MAEEEREGPEVPKPTLLDQIGALITRLDPLLAFIAETERRRESVDKETLKTLKDIAAALMAAPREAFVFEGFPVVRVVTVPSEPLDVKVVSTPLPVVFPPKHKNYFSEEETVVKGKPREIKIREELGRDGEYGYIVSDKGTIVVRINGGEKVTLLRGQAIYFHELHLLVSRLDIFTESTVPLAYRLLVAQLVHQLSPSEVIPKPLGTTKAKGSAATTAGYATIAAITVTKDKTFHVAKVVVSCPEDVMFRLVWDGEDISVEYYVMGKLPFTDWFPWGWHPCIGDGVKKFELHAKYPPGGTAGTVQAEICGEEE